LEEKKEISEDRCAMGGIHQLRDHCISGQLSQGGGRKGEDKRINLTWLMKCHLPALIQASRS